MKTKKPARIKGTVIPAYMGVGKLMILPIDNPDALVEQVARAIGEERWGRVSEGFWTPGSKDLTAQAKAALRSIGVPLKKAK